MAPIAATNVPVLNVPHPQKVFRTVIFFTLACIHYLPTICALYYIILIAVLQILEKATTYLVQYANIGLRSLHTFVCMYTREKLVKTIFAEVEDKQLNIWELQTTTEFVNIR